MNSIPIFFDLFFQLMNLRQQLAVSEASLSYVAHLREVPERVEQIEQRGIRRAKLAFKIVGWCAEQLGDALRILMKTGRGDDEANLVFAATSSAPGHLLKFRCSE